MTTEREPSKARLSEITPAHLGAEADWGDVELFTDAVRDYMEANPDASEDQAMAAIWNDGEMRI